MAKQPTPKKPVRSAAREAMNEGGGNIISKKPTAKKPQTATKKSEPIKGPSLKQKESAAKWNVDNRTSTTKSKAVKLPAKDAPKPSAKFIPKPR